MKKIPFPTLFLFFFAAVVYAIGAATRAGVPGMVYDQIRESLGFTAAQTSASAAPCAIIRLRLPGKSVYYLKEKCRGGDFRLSRAAPSIRRFDGRSSLTHTVTVHFPNNSE